MLHFYFFANLRVQPYLLVRDYPSFVNCSALWFRNELAVQIASCSEFFCVYSSEYGEPLSQMPKPEKPRWQINWFVSVRHVYQHAFH